MSEPTRRWPVAVAQGLLSAGLLMLLAWQADLRQLAALARRPGPPACLLAALLLYNLSKVASALRLNAYQRHAAIRVGEGDNLRLYYAGMFLSLVLPGGIGGDGYKVLTLHRRRAAPLKTLLWITLADRIGGLLVLLFMLCLLVPLLGLPWALAGAPGAALALLLLHRRLLGMGKRGTAAMLASGALVQLLQLACMAMLLAYLRLPAALYLPYLALFLASSVAAALPLSLAGLGTREVTFLYGLQWLRLDPAAGVLAASGFFLVTLASALPGALCLRAPSLPPAAPAEPASYEH